MTESGRGVLGLIGSSAIWGLSPLFYKGLAEVSTLEVLAHRTIWSLVVFTLVLGWQRRLHEVARLISTPRRLAIVAVAATMILANWALFVWSVQTGRTVETSLGYYIFPLVSVTFGVLLLGEGFDRAKGIAVTLAATAVVILTVGLGVPPWVALFLAVTFGIYGLLKKSVSAGPVVSVTAEVLLFAPFALLYLAFVHGPVAMGGIVPVSGTFGQDLRLSLLLALSGPITALPMVLFSYGARRVTLATTGLVQYLNPSLQFGIAVLIFAEPLTRWHAMAFPLIWIALAVYSARAVAQDRSLRRAAASVGTSSTAVK